MHIVKLSFKSLLNSDLCNCVVNISVNKNITGYCKYYSKSTLAIAGAKRGYHGSTHQLIGMSKRLHQVRSVSTSTRADPPDVYNAAVTLLDDLLAQENPHEILVTFVRVRTVPLAVLNAAIRYLSEIY